MLVGCSATATVPLVPTSRDAAPFDAAFVPADAAVMRRDAAPSEPDSGDDCRPRISVDPPDTVAFDIGDQTKTLRITNRGECNLSITRFDISLDGDHRHPSGDDFTISGCASNPCSQQISIDRPNEVGSLLIGVDVMNSCGLRAMGTATLRVGP